MKPENLLKRLLVKYLRVVVLVNLLAVVETLARLGIPLAVRELLDRGLRPHEVAGAFRFALAATSLVLVSSAALFLREYFAQRAGQCSLSDIRATIFGRLLCLPQAELDGRDSSSIISHITNDVSSMENFFTLGLSRFLVCCITLAGCVSLIFFVDSAMGACLFLGLSLTYCALFAINRKAKLFSRLSLDKAGSLLRVVQETLRTAPLIKACRLEPEFRDRFGEVNLGYLGLRVSRSLYNAMLVPAIGSLYWLSIVAVMLVGAFNKGVTIGDTIAIFGYSVILNDALATLGGIGSQYNSAAGGWSRISEFLSTPAAADAGRINKAGFDDCLVFSGVSFGYPGRGKVLENLNLRISRGEKVGLFGKNGCGKSTVLKLLLRFYDDFQGTISVDGIDVRDVSAADYLSLFSIAFQFPIVTSGSIMENISLGNPGLQRRDVERVLGATGLKRLADRLPGGLDQDLGEAGVKLSGGEKQKIGLARALLRNSDILVLDEATAHFDREDEAAFFQDAILRAGGRTTIVVSHNVNLLRSLDRIVWIDGGEVRWDGPPAGLPGELEIHGELRTAAAER